MTVPEQPTEEKKPEPHPLAEFAESFEKFSKEYERKTTFTFPITVTGIKTKLAAPIQTETWRKEAGPGTLVQVRSCKEKHGDKTRLGILIGYIPIHSLVTFEREEGKESEGKLLFETLGDHPLLFIPELKDVVLGCECWWGPITTEEELRQITDEDIGNIWYVRLLKEFAKEAKKEKDHGEPAKPAGK